MGRDKALLPFGGEAMVARVARLVLEAVGGDVVVVARAGQVLPPLPDGVRVVRDVEEGRGPLAGLVEGLRASRGDAVFVTACDAPFVSAAVVRALFARLDAEGAADAVAVAGEAGLHPLCAVYRRSVLPIAERLVADGRLRAGGLLDAVRAVGLTADELRGADPSLDFLRDCDTPEAYAEALARLGGRGGASSVDADA